MTKDMPGRKTLWLTIGTLLMGLVVTGIISWEVERATTSRINEALLDSHDKAVSAVLDRMKLYQYGLHGVRGAVHMVGLDNLSRSSFLRYTETRNYNKNFPGARGFGVIRKVSQYDVESFLQQARNDGWPTFDLLELSTNPGDRYVIQYIEPVERNFKAVGLDIASERNRREAATKALTTGEVQITGPITLVQASGLHLQSFLILMPIYQTPTLPPIEKRQNLAFGWSYAPLIMSEVLADIQVDQKASFLRIQDITDSESDGYFYSSEPNVDEVVKWESSVSEVFGRKWKFEFGIKPAFFSRLNPKNSIHYLTGGIALTLLLASLVYVMSLGRRSKQAALEEQARIASIVEHSADGIIGLSVDRHLLNWNNAARELISEHQSMEKGNELSGLLDSKYHPQLKQIFSELASGERVRTFHVQQERDGMLQWLSITISVIGNGDEAAKGYSVVIRNETLQKEAEQTIQNANLVLEKQVLSRTAELQKVNRLLQSVLDAASQVAIIVFSKDGIVSLFNHGAEQVLGYKSDNVIGHSILKLFSESELNARTLTSTSGSEYCPVGIAAITAVAESEGIERLESNLIRVDKTVVPVSMVITVIKGEKSEVSGYLLIATDISEQMQIKAALVETRDRLLMATNVAELGIWRWDLLSDELNWNERMFEIYGYTENIKSQGVTYQHWRNRVHPDDKESAESALMDVVLRGVEYNTIFRLVTPDGRIKHVKAEARCVKDTADRVTSVIGINVDVTSQIEVEQSLRHAKEQADAASAAKSNFLANMSHEIRTPMNAVIGMLQLINQTPLSDKQKDYLSKAQSASKSLLQLLNDILDYSKIEAGKIDIDLHPVDLESLIRELTVVFSGSQMKSNVELLYDIDLSVPRKILADSLRLKQVLINLVGNALKFTISGTITVIVKLDANEQILFGVKDTGIGISDAQKSKLFQSFNQADPSTARRFGGSGLGLVISKRLTHLMGGKLEFTSEEGVGSYFWFTLPLREGSENKDTNRESSQSLSLHKRALVIDDNPLALEILSEYLQRFGFTVEKAKTGEDGIDIFADNVDADPFDLILVDLRLPDISGLDTARVIRKHSISRKQPRIVMITAHGRDELEKELSVNTPVFDDFITKPVTPRQLSELINPQDSRNPVTDVSNDTQNNQRLCGVTILLVDDNDINRIVADELLSSEGATVINAEGGAQSISILKENSDRVQLVLMDMQMPDVDGIEATTRIRKMPEFQSLPIIAMTANVSVDDIQVCLDAGMNDHIGKPFELDSVVKKVLSHI
ncbi:response regulator [Bowmanella sp. Y26]|uniref:PAS domain-containing hybrid sensor histidine kinase/response regulator n=1 Tax=Bowmanella yangjiangensis TaxID=2811230 RepID=UPI001BDBD461|nr:response regulator [Bowmanella yangjiangensis]MBT1066151.1 response regulator [Bowmanella yangjiangensis]